MRVGLFLETSITAQENIRSYNRFQLEVEDVLEDQVLPLQETTRSIQGGWITRYNGSKLFRRMNLGLLPLGIAAVFCYFGENTRDPRSPWIVVK